MALIRATRCSQPVHHQKLDDESFGLFAELWKHALLERHIVVPDVQRGGSVILTGKRRHPSQTRIRKRLGSFILNLSYFRTKLEAPEHTRDKWWLRQACGEQEADYSMRIMLTEWGVIYLDSETAGLPYVCGHGNWSLVNDLWSNVLRCAVFAVIVLWSVQFDGIPKVTYADKVTTWTSH